MTINWDCDKASHQYTMPLDSSYIQKYAAMMAESRERMYAENMDAAPHVSAMPLSGDTTAPLPWQLARVASLPLHRKPNPW